jgi:hypothetical protein
MIAHIVDFNTLVANDAELHSVGAIYEEDGMRFTAIHRCRGDRAVVVLPALQLTSSITW